MAANRSGPVAIDRRIPANGSAQGQGMAAPGRLAAASAVCGMSSKIAASAMQREREIIGKPCKCGIFAASNQPRDSKTISVRSRAVMLDSAVAEKHPPGDFHGCQCAFQQSEDHGQAAGLHL